MRSLMQMTFFTIFLSSSLYAHSSSGIFEGWLSWFGYYHYIFVHFPIALIIMACIAELFFIYKKEVQYNFVVNFLLIFALIFLIPTALSGLSLVESGTQENSPLIGWHELFAFLTFSLNIATLFIRNTTGLRTLYLWSLFFLLISVMGTAHFGGLMAFGDFNLFPPFF